MIDALIAAVALLTLATLYCAWRAWTLFRTWTPVAATVWKSGYSDLERQDDFWHFGSPFGTLRGWNWRDGEDARLIEDDVVFTDEDGERRHALVERRVHRGWRPMNVYTVWYDPADPSRVTAFGPLYWLLLMLVFASALAGFFRLGMELG